MVQRSAGAKVLVLSASLLATSALAQFSVDLSGAEPTTALSAPVILGGSGCDGDILRLSVAGGLPGNDYEVWSAVWTPSSGTILVSPLGYFPVDANADGITQADILDPRSMGMDTIAAVQVSAAGWSNYSPVFKLRDPTVLDEPWLAPTPIWECGLATAVHGQQAGDEATLFTGNNRVRAVVPSAGSSHHYMEAGPLGGLCAGETLTARYQTCKSAQTGGSAISPLSQPVVVAAWTGGPRLPLPRVIPNSMLPGSDRFMLEGVEHGATITLTHDRGSGLETWTAVCPWDPCPISTPPTVGPLKEGDSLTASQKLCPGTDSTPAKAEVRSCGDVPAPTLAAPPRVGDVSIQLESYSPGTEIVVYASSDELDPSLGLVPIGRSMAAGTVNLFRAIEQADRWIVVAQVSAACALTHGSGYVVGGEG